MKKIFICIATLLIAADSFAQKPSHNIYLGMDFVSTGLDASGLNINYKNYEFNDPSLGFTFGYKYIIPVHKLISVAAGLEYKNFKSEFSRLHYDDGLSPDIRYISENIKMSRLAIPVNINFNFLTKDKFSFYLTGGIDIIILNNANREAEYSIASPPNGYVYLTYDKKEKIKFNQDNSVGLSWFAGVGSNFAIKKCRFNAELSFFNDISENTFLTLQTIEEPAYFNAKFKGYEIKIGYIF